MGGVGGILDLIARGLVAPRQTARIVIDARPAPLARLTLVGLAAVVQGLVWTLSMLIAPGEGGAVQGFGLAGHLLMICLNFVNYGVTGFLAFHLGKAANGRGGRDEVFSAVAWQMTLSAALSPLQALALHNGALAGAALAVYLGLAIWYLGACIAEAHRFARTVPVVIAVAGFMIGLGTVIGLLLSGARP